MEELWDRVQVERWDQVLLRFVERVVAVPVLRLVDEWNCEIVVSVSLSGSLLRMLVGSSIAGGKSGCQ